MGVSEKNRSVGFLPAFKDEETGQVIIAKYKNGAPAPIHVIVGLPVDWATAFDEDGDISCLKSSITAGFVRDDRFYTRAEACIVTDG